ncbi:hypothetical protein B296_00009278 [Ensete ventricosum]|uniref:Uncharacterized protein n=1 Tax=Ensete ventricosum TaxID=4639 RepID=A0A427AAY3_ENSVE|nr:hypothetical protein B296_00009278 [Ensete ventricosum]
MVELPVPGWRPTATGRKGSLEMQKREAGKSGGSFTTPAKRGRPFGSTAAAAAAAAATSAAAGDASSPASLLGPSLQITTSFAG